MTDSTVKFDGRRCSLSNANGSTGISSSQKRSETRTAVCSHASAAITFDFPEAFGPNTAATGSRLSPRFGTGRTSARSRSTATIDSSAASSIERKLATSKRINTATPSLDQAVSIAPVSCIGDEKQRVSTPGQRSN